MLRIVGEPKPPWRCRTTERWHPIPCDECGALMEVGDVLWLFDNGLRIRIVHDECPPPWTPTVVAGGGSARPTQLRLPFLAAVPEDEP